MKFHRNSEGAVAIMVGLLLVILIGVTAFAIDFGIVWVANKQLHNAADAGALAGARVLGYYRCLKSVKPDECTPVSGVVTTGSANQAVTPKVVDVVGDNSAFDTPTLEADPAADIQLGKWTMSTQTWDPAVPESECNAVRVIARKETDSNNGALPSFFGRIFDVNEYATRKEAIAAITGISEVEPGALVPVGISVLKCPSTNIRMQNTGESCAGWTTLDRDKQVNKPNMENAITSPSPELKVGAQIQFGGGVVSSVFKAFYNEFESNKDPTTGLWEVMVPVFNEGADCGNPNQTLTVIGFATMQISCVDWTGDATIDRPDCVPSTPSHDNEIVGDMVCNIIREGPGGGGDYGTLGTIPGLVR